MTAGDVYVVKGSTHAKQSVMFDGTDDLQTTEYPGGTCL